MDTRMHATLTMSIAAGTIGLLLTVLQPVQLAAQVPVDKSGLDILCSRKGDVYSPAPKPGGTSSCSFADGSVMTCDTKTEKCEVKSDPKTQRALNTELNMVRMVKELSDKVDRLSAQVKALTAAKK